MMAGGQGTQLNSLLQMPPEVRACAFLRVETSKGCPFLPCCCTIGLLAAAKPLCREVNAEQGTQRSMAQGNGVRRTRASASSLPFPAEITAGVPRISRHLPTPQQHFPGVPSHRPLSVKGSDRGADK